MKSSTFASLPDSNTTPYFTQSLFLPFEGVQPKVKARPTLGGKGAIGKEGKSGFDGKRLGKGGLRRRRKVVRDSNSGITKGKRLGKGGLGRHRKVVRDSISEITKEDIRRLTRCDDV